MVFNEMPRCLSLLKTTTKPAGISGGAISVRLQANLYEVEWHKRLTKESGKRLIDESPELLKSVVKFALVLF